VESCILGEKLPYSWSTREPSPSGRGKPTGPPRIPAFGGWMQGEFFLNISGSRGFPRPEKQLTGSTDNDSPDLEAATLSVELAPHSPHRRSLIVFRHRDSSDSLPGCRFHMRGAAVVVSHQRVIQITGDSDRLLSVRSLV
jgi:hypothetical protein